MWVLCRVGEVVFSVVDIFLINFKLVIIVSIGFDVVFRCFGYVYEFGI